MKKIDLKKASIFLPPLITAVIMLAIYAANGIYPFGSGSIVYDDMTQCNIPLYYAAWDAIHDGGGVLFNWNTASGIFVPSVLTTLLSPINFFFLLFSSRSAIFDGMSFLIMAKLIACSATAMVFFKRMFPGVSAYWHTIFSVLYAFNAYVLQYYINNSWLVIVAMFPLVLASLDCLLRQKKILPYILTLTYCLAAQLYLSYMLYLFLFLVGGLYIFLVLPKEGRGQTVFRFGASSVAALFLSAAVSLPSYYYMTASSRYQNTKNYKEIVISTVSNPETKLAMLIILTALPLALIALMLLRFREEKKKIGFCVLALLTCALPILFENVNLLWHMGSYVGFSMRFAFMLSLTIMGCACYAIQRFGDKMLFRGKIYVRIPAIILAVLVSMFATWVLLEKAYTAPDAGYAIFSRTTYKPVILTFLLFFISYLLLLRFGAKKMTCVLAGAMVLLETGFYANRAFSIGKPRQYEYSLSFITDSEGIYNELELPYNELTRIKSIDSALNTNYPLMINFPSMSNFTHVLSADIKSHMSRIGYSYIYTRILDAGGTYFTDALLGYRYVISRTPLSDAMYSFVEMAGGYFIYSIDSALPFGILSDDTILDENAFGENVFVTNNNISKAVFGEELFTYPEFMRTVDPPEFSEYGKETIVYNVDIPDNGQLYFASSSMAKRKCLRISVNGEVLDVPSLGDQTNDRYSARFNNAIMNLGSFEGESVEVRIEIMNDKYASPETLRVYFGLLDTDRFSELCETADGTTDASADGRTLSVTANAESEGSYLFLPVAYDNGWSCTVNGEDSEVETALGAFMAIKLHEGENTVELRFMPRGMKLGIAVSTVSLLILIAFLLLLRKRKCVQSQDKPDNAFFMTVDTGYLLATLVAYGAVYAVPICVRLFAYARDWLLK